MTRDKLNNDIILQTQDKYTLKDTNSVQHNNVNAFMINVILEGKGNYESLSSDYKIKTQKGYTLLNMLKTDDGISKIAKGTHNKFVSLMIPKSFLEQNLPDHKYKDKFLNFFETNKNIENISNHKTNLKTQSLALEIFNNPYTNQLEKLFIESKVLELIYTEFTNLFNQNNIKINQEVRFSNQDKEAIYYAREILTKNLQNPPSMKELAKLVAINDLKLKVGFRKYFDETPYSVSKEYRLQEAKRLLQVGALNINEITEHIGYKYSSNFTQAFIKRFGIRPNDCKNGIN